MRRLSHKIKQKTQKITYTHTPSVKFFRIVKSTSITQKENGLSFNNTFVCFDADMKNKFELYFTQFEEILQRVSLSVRRNSEQLLKLFDYDYQNIYKFPCTYLSDVENSHLKSNETEQFIIIAHNVKTSSKLTEKTTKY